MTGGHHDLSQHSEVTKLPGALALPVGGPNSVVSQMVSQGAILHKHTKATRGVPALGFSLKADN